MFYTNCKKTVDAAYEDYFVQKFDHLIEKTNEALEA